MLPDCSTCEKHPISTGHCTKQEIQNCLRDSTCKHCDSDEYWYPYGPHESRHCFVCGAEWPVYK